MRVKRDKSPLMELIEMRNGGRPIEELIRSGIESGQTQEEIARSLGISFFTLRSWLYRLGARIDSSVRFEPAATSGTD